MTFTPDQSFYSLIASPASLAHGGLKRAVNLGTIVPDPNGIGSARRPLLFPWPYSEDDAGQPFPDGLMAMYYGPITHPSGTDFSLQDDEDFPDGTDWPGYAGGLSGGGQVIAVPSELPIGYVRNLEHCLRYRHQGGDIRVRNMAQFYRRGSLVNWKHGFPEYDVRGPLDGCNVDPEDGIYPTASSIWNFPRVMANGSLWEHKWGPFCSGKTTALGAGVSDTGVGSPGASEADIGGAWVIPTPGWRYALLRFSFFTGHVANVRVKVTRNSDWSAGSGGPGAVTVQELNTGPLASGSQFSIGEILPPVGTLGGCHIHFYVTPTTSPFETYDLSAYVTLGPRCDIPPICTIVCRDVDDNECVSVGGYVESILANPDSTPYFDITGSFSEPSAYFNGDMSFVYARIAGLTPGGSYQIEVDPGYSESEIITICAGEYGQPGAGVSGPGPFPFTANAAGTQWAIIYYPSYVSARYRVSPA